MNDEEIYEAFRIAVRAKEGHLALLEYTQKLNNPVEKKKFTAEAFKAWLFEVYPKVEGSTKLKLDDDNNEIVNLLCHYFAEDERFEKAGYDLNKGIILIGPKGCGKSSLMKCFNKIQGVDNPKTEYGFKNCISIMQEYSKEGYSVINKYTQVIKNSYMDAGGWCFDDLGYENTGKHYGKDANIMQEILTLCYENVDLRGKIHATSNLDADDFEELYGNRVRSRTNQMFNYIFFPTTSPDRRK